MQISKNVSKTAFEDFLKELEKELKVGKEEETKKKKEEEDSSVCCFRNDGDGGFSVTIPAGKSVTVRIPSAVIEGMVPGGGKVNSSGGGGKDGSGDGKDVLVAGGECNSVYSDYGTMTSRRKGRVGSSGSSGGGGGGGSGGSSGGDGGNGGNVSRSNSCNSGSSSKKVGFQ